MHKGEEIMTEKEKEIIKKHYENSYWLDYYLKNLDSVIDIDGKYYWGIDKPSIETSFCFGYGYCGISTEEEDKRASDMAMMARTDEQYFLNENMVKMEDLKKSVEKAKTFCFNNDDGELYLIDNMYFQKYPFDTPPVYRDITPEEKKTMLKMVEAATERFKKRLNVYLKRYGLSKINSWSYLSD